MKKSIWCVILFSVVWVGCDQSEKIALSVRQIEDSIDTVTRAVQNMRRSADTTGHNLSKATHIAKTATSSSESLINTIDSILDCLDQVRNQTTDATLKYYALTPAQRKIKKHELKYVRALNRQKAYSRAITPNEHYFNEARKYAEYCIKDAQSILELIQDGSQNIESTVLKSEKRLKEMQNWIEKAQNEESVTTVQTLAQNAQGTTHTVSMMLPLINDFNELVTKSLEELETLEQKCQRNVKNATASVAPVVAEIERLDAFFYQK